MEINSLYLMRNLLYICDISIRFAIYNFVAFGEVFSSIGVREPQPAASEAFTKFGEAHRNMERFAIKMLRTVKPVSFTPDVTYMIEVM